MGSLTLQLNRGYATTIDQEDVIKLNGYNWFVRKNIHKNSDLYAVAMTIVNGKRKVVRLHRLIMGITDPKVQVDHIDGNGLNNCRSNLRVATSRQNNQNRKKRINTSSKYKGVTWDASKRKWLCYCNQKHIGRFTDEVEAAKAYDAKARELFKEFAHLNFNV